MRFAKVLLLAAFVSAAPFGAVAQTPPAQPTQSPISGVSPAEGGLYPQVGVSPVPIVVNQPPAAVSVGTLGSEVLNWLAAVFGAPVAAFLVLWLKALAKKAGIDVSQAASDKLDDIIERGINAGAAKAGADLDGKLTVDVQNKVLAEAVNYAKAHGANTIKDLAASNGAFAFLKSVDPNDPKVHEALAARATAALNKISPATVIEAAAVPAPAAPAAAAQTAAPPAQAAS